MKIAISGAGIAGAALAYWLLRAGHEPTLIEKASHLRSGGYMIDFWGLGYTVAERMGILPAVREAGYSVREVRFVDDRGHRAGGFSADLFHDALNDRFTSLPRGQLATEIFRSVEDRVETIFDESIATLSECRDGVDVAFEHSPPRRFDLVVGADGLHSTVRKLAFGAESWFERDIGYRVAAFEVDGFRPRDELVYVSHTAPGRQISRFAERHDRTLFLFVFAAEHMPGPEPRDVMERRATLRGVFGGMGWETPHILAAMDQAEDIYFDRVSQIEMPVWSKGRVALLGDAAACVSLLAGEGCGLALTEAYVMAGELARAGGDHVQAFAGYEERLRSMITVKQAAARKFAAAFAPRTAIGVWFRNQATRLMTIPPLAELFLGRDLRNGMELPDYGI
jgi:2-polyprenyl-6-methoxyphenol hydroxylase-like FAD-dependent oxidoreductase